MEQTETMEPSVTLPKKAQILGLIVWLFLCFLAAAAGSAASLQAAPFYTQLARPEWSPPPMLFGPVWTILYILMAFAAWLIWRIEGFWAARTALSLFLIQLVLNGLWSWLFFAWRLGGLAFAEILVLWAFILATLIAFWRIRPLAGALLIPYLLWVSFASALNYTLWKLNPLILG
jgi:tryptophan-rich sensory protein